MNPNEELINKFYEAFQNKDPDAMKTCYSKDVTFSDEVFKNLDYRHVNGMWSMLIRRGKDLELVYDSVEANDSRGSANWTATYTFSGRKVVNKIHAEFQFENGLIVSHIDSFDFYKWAKQALPFGFILGFFIRSKVQAQSMKQLEKYVAKHDI
mmetsp:Transcript_677/g.816  ORF Transcript_677/g.816 Transcript_677/m.816 type:complete len:153 (-) Transcript_677:555-1013(-)|eukprot:CAMPEP_0204824654 /NCGR_PEP_ID=MMETSP1346-20131115/2655_1 /ASSEMBLY_ACC=CAM_ASM_000771 /TAXON_ID=215587 /ORGANISM="Aplanochytrium stocchinoi, Strain GSBS06" /LENGTH=152 /DNA_ID=CAMNT_0051951923 /DNA_START=225 /DNA_END=683 /DNA_ORIENTATION=+